MGFQIAVITSNGGIPVFTCGSDGCPIPFPVLGSLNGVWLYCKSNAGDLRTMENDMGTVVWKEFLESLLFVCITKHGEPYVPECVADNVIDMCFGAMVMAVGADGLKNFSNAELLKRDLKASSPVISHILTSFTTGKQRLFAGVTGLPDVLICEETPKLQEIVEAFCEKNETPYGLLTVGGKVIAASRSWWTALTSAEKALFLIYSVHQENGVARDCPVYLPVKSPSVPYRFVSMTLLESRKDEERVCFSLLCGATPPIADVMRQVPVAFGHVADLLKNVASNVSSPTGNGGLPRRLTIHRTILGFLCMDLERGKNVSFVCGSVGEAEVGGGGDHRQKVSLAEAANRAWLTAAFCDTRDVFTFQTHGLENMGNKQSFSSRTSHLPCNECYQNYGDHHVYSLERWPFQISVLFESGIPRSAMQIMASELLEDLTNQKHVSSF